MAAQAKKQIGSLFRKNLLDLVKGLRSHKGNESEYINQCLSEIKEEVKSIDKNQKAIAISKLTYLYMLGYDISFAHFNVVEVMSQPSFNHRRIAYLAASLSFTVDTDVILLTVHLFKKRFKNSSSGGGGSSSSNIALQEGGMYESGCAINCLANICTPYLAETLLEDIYSMMNSSKPYLRKKSVLVLYSIFRKFPRALRLTFDRLKEKLKDDDAGVQNAAVNVICELARKNPSNYLSLLPHLFDLLQNSNNNWMLIKLVKLLGSLIPAEPRLGRKLQEPLTHIITNTPAKSLLYECINTVTTCEQMQRSMIRLCLDKLRTFVEDPDQNLKYLGLLGLNKIMDKNKKAVAQHKDLILQCLDDPDITIRMRALDLITSMVNEKNLEVIIQRLTDHLYGTDGNYRDHVLEQIINVCRKHDYEFVRDFAWYVQLLTNMTGLSSMCKSNAELVSSQLMDVTIRVPEVREFSVLQMEGIIINNGLISDAHNMQSNAICRILEASSYIVGEYSQYVTQHLTLLSAMLQSRISSLPGDIQCIFIHNALKVVCSGLVKFIVDEDEDDDDDESKDEENEVLEGGSGNKVDDLITGAIRLLEPLATSSFIEVQERANAYLFFVKWLQDEFKENSDEKEDIVLSFQQLFSSELMPLHPNSQQVIAEKIPNGLDLDKWIFDEPPDDSDDDSLANISDQDQDLWFPSDPDDDNSNFFSSKSTKKPKGKLSAKQKEILEKQSAARKARQEGDYYLKGDDDMDNHNNNNDSDDEEDRKKKRKKRRKHKDKGLSNSDIETAPIEKLDDIDGKLEVHPKGSKLKKVDKASLPSIKKYTIKKAYDDPTNKGKKSKGKKGKNKDNKKSSRNKPQISGNSYGDDLALDLDLTQPIDPSEMPTIKAYNQDEIVYKDTRSNENDKKNKKDKKKDKKKMSKKERKKEKKLREKEKKRAKREKKKIKKALKAQQREAAEEREQEAKEKEEEEPQQQQQEEEDDLMGFLSGKSSKKKSSKQSNKQEGDLLDFMNDNKPKKSSKTQSNGGSRGGGDTGDDFLNGILGINGNANGHKNKKHDEKEEDEDDEEEPPSKKKRDKKSKKNKKNGIIDGDINEATEILHEDDSIRISYSAQPSSKKPSSYLDIKFMTENIGSSIIKSIKLNLSKSSSFKPKDKDETKYTLAKKLAPNSSKITIIKMKCITYSGENDHIKCKISYNDNKTGSLLIKLQTHCFITNESINNEVNDEETLLKFVDDKEKCGYKSCEKIKLGQNKSIADALDTLVKIWRVNNVTTGKSKATYFAKLMQNKYLAIYVRINTKKNAIEITLNGTQQQFVDAMLEQFKSIILN